jgi:hypothetical protein
MFDMFSMANAIIQVVEPSLELVETGKTVATRHKNRRYMIYFKILNEPGTLLQLSLG